MFCVIQEVELKKPNKRGHPKELISEFKQMTFQGKDCSYYQHRYSEECFERQIKKAYKISIHQSNRINGKVEKKQCSLCTVSYYDIAEGWFTVYDYCDRKISAAADKLGISVDTIYDLVQAKVDTLIIAIQCEYQQTKEYITHKEHNRITTLYAANKAKFNEEYGCSGSYSRYDEIYDVYGNLMNQVKLDEVKSDYKFRQEYEEKSRSYQKEFYSNYSKYFSGSGGSGYSESICSNHNEEDKETLKQFYRELCKKFHPDSNPDKDTSKQMQLLNQLKGQWGI